jgi:ribosomal protein S18 acetylase RimI-like enzyme
LRVSRELLAVYRPSLASSEITSVAAAVLREWMSFVALPGWRCVVARSTSDQPVIGFAIGYSGTPANSWHHLTRIALLRSGLKAQRVDEYLHDYLVLAEVHVSGQVQGRGVGAQLVSAVIDDWSRPVALTVQDSEGPHLNRAWRLYRSFGFVPVARRLRIAGSARQFAVMYRPADDARRGLASADAETDGALS